MVGVPVQLESGYCSHLAGTLYKLLEYVEQGLHELGESTCTSKLQKWHQPAKRPVVPLPVQKVQFKKLKPES